MIWRMPRIRAGPRRRTPHSTPFAAARSCSTASDGLVSTAGAGRGRQGGEVQGVRWHGRVAEAFRVAERRACPHRQPGRAVPHRVAKGDGDGRYPVLRLARAVHRAALDRLRSSPGRTLAGPLLPGRPVQHDRAQAIQRASVRAVGPQHAGAGEVLAFGEVDRRSRWGRWTCPRVGGSGSGCLGRGGRAPRY